MSALRSLTVLAVALAAAAPAWADKPEEKWETRAVADKPGPLTLDPAKAYILIKADYVVMPTLMQLSSEEQAAAHARRRAEALTKEHGKWVKRHANWEAEMKRWQKGMKKPEEPVEPTEANFGFPEYERVHSVMLGPQFRFSKEGSSVYLQEVPPGEYLFYGQANVCACLGTVSFEAPAGKIVPVELRLSLVDAIQDAPKESRPKTSLDLPAGTSQFLLRAAEVGDPRLPADAIVRPAFKPAGTRPNWSGVEVDRVMPMPGVFRYARGQQVDDSAPAAAVAASVDPGEMPAETPAGEAGPDDAAASATPSGE